MLKVGGGGAVGGVIGETVFAFYQLPTTGNNHRFNGNNHSFDKLRTGVSRTVIGHLWFLVKFLANAVTNKVANNIETVFFNNSLYGMTYFTHMITNPCLFYADV